MLNELLEYKDYTYAIRNGCMTPDGREPRIARYTLLRSGSIPERAASVVARHVLFENGPQWPDGDQIKKAATVLASWFGYGEGPVKGYEDIQDWVPRYVKGIFGEDEKETEKILSLHEGLKNRRISQDVPVAQKTDQNEIVFGKVIANALRAGELKEYVLAGDLDRALAVDLYDVRLQEGKKANGRSKANKDFLLKATAWYIRGLVDFGEDVNYGTAAVQIVYTVFSNWKTANGKVETKDFQKYRYGSREEPLFIISVNRDEPSSAKRKNPAFLYFKVNKRWIDQGEWTLLDVTHLSDEEREQKIHRYLLSHPTHTVYEDYGNAFFAQYRLENGLMEYTPASL